MIPRYATALPPGRRNSRQAERDPAAASAKGPGLPQRKAASPQPARAQHDVVKVEETDIWSTGDMT